MAGTRLKQTKPPVLPADAPRATSLEADGFDPEPRFMIYGLGWQGYEAMLQVLGDRQIRLTYDHGDLELMSPSCDHERFKKILARLVEAITEELGIPCIAAGSTTWRRKKADRGLEPDECYYLFDRVKKVMKRQIDLSVDPPPNLAIEIDITRGSIDRMAVYASLGADEVWQFNGERLCAVRLTRARTYKACDRSLHFPFLSLDDVCRLAQEGLQADQTKWIPRVRRWIREELAPRYAQSHEGESAQ